jgi:hypothetical protein
VEQTFATRALSQLFPAGELVNPSTGKEKYRARRLRVCDASPKRVFGETCNRPYSS